MGASLPWTLARGFRAVRTASRTHGIGTALRWAASGSLRPACFIGLVNSAETCEAPTGRLECAVWSRAEMAAWRARQHWVPVSYLRDEIEPVEQCVVGLVDDQVAALIWVYPAPASSRFFVLRPGDVELNHGFVLNQFRRRGFFTDVLRYASMWCLEAGARRVFAAVDEKNSPSLHGFRGAGFRDFARIRHVLLWRPRFRTPG